VRHDDDDAHVDGVQLLESIFPMKPFRLKFTDKREFGQI
jgi:hypothetical protein